MSKQRILPLEPESSLGQAKGRKWVVYAVIAVAAVLIVAYIDGGEEPIRPIEQQISLPSAGAASLNSGERE